MVQRTWLRLLRYAVVAFVVFCVTSAAIIAWDGLTDEVAVSDIAVVLGNTVEEDGLPSRRLKGRLDKAVDLYRHGWFPMILVSGGLGKEGYNEAVVMQQYLVEQGIPSSRIVVDGNGNNTFLTAKYSANLMTARGWRSALVISQYFHISRSRLALERFGVPRIYAAHADYYEWKDIYSLGREVAAYGYYFIRHYQ